MERYLKECVESILEQTLKDIEIICIDDGSTDNTLAILHELSKNHKCIKVVVQNRMGAGAARNRGISEAVGEFVAFMDSDDFYASRSALEELYIGATENGVNVAGGRLIALREGKIVKSGLKTIEATKFPKREIITYDSLQKIYGYSSYIYKREYLLHKGITFPQYSRMQDPPFMLNALANAGEIYVTDVEVYVYRQFDKVLDMRSTKVVLDMISSYVDMASFASKNAFYGVLQEVYQSICAYKVYIFLHILAGNKDVYDKWRLLDSCFTSDIKKNKEYDLNKSFEQIKSFIEEYSIEMNTLLDVMVQAKKVIIFGAGVQGRKLYSVIKNKPDIKFGGFAVSDDKPSGTAGGVQIKSIKDYQCEKDDALLVIAAKEHYVSEMKSIAEEYGFLHICIVTKDVVDVDNFEINTNIFAV
jgi:glycosyltransferase involved in cell wall biosynthesis